MTKTGINEGIHTALITPFDSQGNIDWQSFENLIGEQVEAGVAGIVISGTTGESPTLSVQEKLSLLKKAKVLCGSKIQVMFGSGGNNTSQSIELSKLAIDAGADSLLIVTPPYNKPSLKGLCAHYEAIANLSDLPICLYHVPGRTAQKLTANEISEICKINKVVAIKEASADLALFGETVRDSNCMVFSGDDPTFLPSLAAGGTGVVSVISNLLPKAFVALFDAFKKGDNASATDIHLNLLEICQAMFIEPNPTPLKAILAEQKRISSPNVRLPLVPPEESSIKQILDVYSTIPDNLKP